MSKQKILYQMKEEDFIKKEFQEYKKLVRNGRYVCRSYGQVARKKKYLCKTVEL